MHPAPSIVVFTVASGAGFGLLATLGVFGMLGLFAPELWFGLVAFALAFALAGGGLVSSAFHLGRPERAWRAFSQWRTSWLSREGVLAVLTFIPAALFALGWVCYGQIWAPAGLATALLGALTVHATGMIYATLKPIRQWTSPWTVPGYLAMATASGAVLANALAHLFGQGSAPLGATACAALAIAWIVKVSYWEAAKQDAPSTTASATGLKGRVRLLEAPNTESNFIMKEMGFRTARKHAERLRRITHLSGFLAPLVCVLAAELLEPGALAGFLALLAVPAAAVGLLAERWLFFAEAKHTVMLYYGADAA